MSDAEPETDTPPIFRRSRPAAEVQAVAEPETTSPATTIPSTPDVPDTDPADDSAAHATEAGIAARLKLADPAILAGQQALLAATVERLTAIANRAD